MTNQQAYENLCIKAERFDKVVDALNAIRKEITEMHTFKCIYDEDCIHGDPIDRDDVLGVIDKYYGQLTND